jgi:hypothetical protein
MALYHFSKLAEVNVRKRGNEEESMIENLRKNIGRTFGEC